LDYKFSWLHGLVYVDNISNKEYREINIIGKVTAVKELNQMVEKGILKIVGKGRPLRYELND